MAMKSSRFDTGVKIYLKKDLPPRGRRPPAEPGSLIRAKLWRSKKEKKRKEKKVALRRETVSVYNVL